MNTYISHKHKIHHLSIYFALLGLIVSPSFAFAQGYGLGGGLGGGGLGGNRMGSTTGGNLAGAGGGYYGSAQAAIDQSALKGNHEMQRNAADFEDYLLQKRNAFALQIQQNEIADEKLRAYAEKRLKALSAKGKSLNTAEQAESHDLMSWLKKDAEQRANNLAWLKRQDSEIAMVDQDQDVSFKNQRNALHNLFIDSQNVSSEFNWRQQMQLANLHQSQELQGELYAAHQPYANQGAGGYSNYGGGGYGRRWGY